MNSVTERIEIMDSFALLSGGRNKPIEKRLRNNSILLGLDMILILIASAAIIAAVVVEISGIETRYNWSRTSMFVLFSFNFLNAICIEFYKRLLLKHLQFLEHSVPVDFDENFNLELNQIVTAINKPKTQNIIIVSLAVIVLIGATANIFMDYQLPNYKLFIIPTLLFYVLTLLNAVNTYKKLKANIDEVEKSQDQSQPQLV